MSCANDPADVSPRETIRAATACDLETILRSYAAGLWKRDCDAEAVPADRRDLYRVLACTGGVVPSSRVIAKLLARRVN